MHEPILKSHWERFRLPIQLDAVTATKLLAPITNAPIEKVTLFAEGCANSNYKISFKNNEQPVVIRFYVRNGSTLSYEVAALKWMKDLIPVPRLFYADSSCTLYSYPYVITEWVEGRLLRDVIISRDENAIKECAFDAGKYLSVLRNIRFSKGGFFEFSNEDGVDTPKLDEKLIRPFRQDEEYLPYINTLLSESKVVEALSQTLHQAIHQWVEHHIEFIPNINPANLTHGDFDLANLLVKQVKGKWQIAGVLDWEFMFAGTYLLDMGLMLRYSHKLPEYYKQKFVEGVEAFSGRLPTEWQKQARLMDLLCLLQLLYYNPVSERPNMNRDVVALIANLVLC